MTSPVSKVKYAALTFLLLAACKNSASQDSVTKSDWEKEAEADKARSYVVDWSCEPKQFGRAAEKTVEYQEEYCEWRVEKTTKTEKVCRFTSSFDETRDFSLNSRGQTPFNTIGAARYLVDSCADNATDRLEKKLGSGKLCSGLPDACVAERNSDPEICDKIRWTTKERFEKRLDYCVDQLPVRDSDKTETPFMQFGLLTDLPENCSFATEDKTEVLCTVAKNEDCFSVAGQLRVGLRVYTKAADSEAELPIADACYQPLITEVPEEETSEEISVTNSDGSRQSSANTDSDSVSANSSASVSER